MIRPVAQRLHFLVLPLLLATACTPSEGSPTAAPVAEQPASETVSATSAPADLASLEADSEGTRLLGSGNITLRYPEDATVERLDPTSWRIVGPEVAVRLPDGAGTIQGPAYELTMTIHDNAAREPIASWARAHLLDAWRAARDANQLPAGFPIGEDGTFDEQRLRTGSVAGRPALRAEFFGGDSYVHHDFVDAGGEVVELVHTAEIEENVPYSPLQAGVYGLMLSTLRVSDAEADASGATIEGVLRDLHTVAATGDDRVLDTSWSPGGETLVAVTAHGDGRDVLVVEPDGVVRSIGAEAMDALFRAAGQDSRPLNTIDIEITGWDGPRTLRLRLQPWSAGAPEPLPEVEVTLDLDSGAVATAVGEG